MFDLEMRPLCQLVGIVLVLVYLSCGSSVTVLGSGRDGGADGTSGLGGTAGVAGAGGTGGAAQTSSSAGGWTSPCGIDCSGIPTNECFSAICDEESGTCAVAAVANGTTCDDELFCTVNDTCTDGLCGGPARDCASGPGPCDSVVCDEDNDACAPTFLADGTPCDPNNLCIIQPTCQKGICTGPEKETFFCPAPNECHVCKCNPSNGQFVAVPGNFGSTCINVADFCVTGICDTMGNCGAMQPKSCPSLPACYTSLGCNPNTGNCEQTLTTQCVGGDGCCPSGCVPATDSDCP